jgi:MtN3 and saliva related transmembrane protein
MCMNFNGSDMLGIIAGSLTTAAFIPQVIKTYKTRSTGDISLLMFVTLCIGVLLWTIYGIVLGLWPVIVSNMVSFLLAGIIIVLKVFSR